MTEYQKSDQAAMISELYVGMIGIEEQIKNCSHTLNLLASDIDTLTRSLGTFDSQLAAHKKEALEDIAKTAKIIVEQCLEELHSKLSAPENPPATEQNWFTKLFQRK